MISSHCLQDGCYYCGDTATEWDHIVPKKRGGKDALDNLIPACTWCNSKKAANTLHEFRKILSKNGRRADFDTPEPHAVIGKTYFIPGKGFVRFESEDGSVIIKNHSRYGGSIPTNIQYHIKE